MFLKYFIAGFLSKGLASFDDVVTRIPILAHLTRTLRGRLAFSIGNLLAVTAIIVVARLFTSLLEEIPYTHIITGVLILALAIAVHFNAFGKKKEKEIKKQEHQIKKHISFKKFFRLIGAGFLISFITLIDDFVVLTPMFLGSLQSQFYAVLGIYASTLIQLVLIVYLAKKISRIKHVKKIAVGGLIVLAFLVFFRVF